MRAPAFWWRRRPSLTARLLQPVGAIYGLITRLRFAPKGGTPAPVPVVCIGNPTVGGAGKTPSAIAIAGLLQELGHRPVFLTRGFGGRQRGPVLVDPAQHDTRAVGDEPLLLARQAPTIVSANRVAGAQLAAKHGDIIVMDDGFQNPSLAKTLSILVIDGQVGCGNGLCVPAGPLRMALAPQLAAADAVLIVGGDAVQIGQMLRRNEIKALHGDIVARVPAILRKQPVIAYSGIGRPQKFFDTLVSAGISVSAKLPFPDHHHFSNSEAEALIAHAAREPAILVTTEKDYVRLDAGGDTPLARLRQASQTLPISLQFNPASRDWLKQKLAALRSR